MYNFRCFVNNFGIEAWQRCLTTMLGDDAWRRCLAAMLGCDAWQRCFNNTIKTVSSIIIRIIIVESVIIIFVGSLWNGYDNCWKKFLKSFLEGPIFEGMPPSAAYLGKVAFQDVRSRMTFWWSYNSKRRKFLGFQNKNIRGSLYSLIFRKH
jgi:hypothetical protein